jgi:hypothetical protein
MLRYCKACCPPHRSEQMGDGNELGDKYGANVILPTLSDIIGAFLLEFTDFLKALQQKYQPQSRSIFKLLSNPWLQ